MHLYELALAEGETSRDLMARARQIGMDGITATTVLSEDQIRRLCPQRAQRAPATTTAPAGGANGDARTPRTGPSMAAVAVALVVALAVAATGIAVLGGGAGAPGEAQAAAATRDADDDASGAAEDEVAPLPADLELVVVDGQALCVGWPPVAEWAAGAAC